MDVVTNSFVIPLYFIFCKKKRKKKKDWVAGNRDISTAIL